MAASEKPLMFLLQAVFFSTLLAAPCLAAHQKPEIPPIRQWTKLPPDVAASHLIKKVAPIYPAFAKAAGIQRVVSVGVAISPDGRIHSIIARPTGWACLQQAAMTAAWQYVYRPFEKDGHPIGVQTSEEIVFKLPGHHSVFRPPPAPQPYMYVLHDLYKDATPVGDGPPEIRSWVLSQLRKDSSYSFWGKRGAFKSMKYGLPANMVEIPTKAPGSRIYLVIDNMQVPDRGAVLCGNGGCDIWLVEDDAGVVRHSVGSAGWGFFVRRRKGSLYPDIFLAFTMSATEVDVDGYVRAGGHWGLLYCGTTDGGLHLCRN